MGGWDPAIAVAGLVVGIVVGMTGMGGLPLTSVAVRRTATGGYRIVGVAGDYEDARAWLTGTDAAEA